jgi:hypothetical protein
MVIGRRNVTCPEFRSEPVLNEFVKKFLLMRKMTGYVDTGLYFGGLRSVNLVTVGTIIRHQLVDEFT